MPFRTENYILYVNIRGQSWLTESKQKQIEAFTKFNNCDIVHLQESHIVEETFSNCDYLTSSFNIIANNSPTRYGTESLVRSELMTENVRFDTEGRAIVFEIGQFTTANLYLHSGTDSDSRKGREHYCCETLPQLLLNSNNMGCAGGDLSCRGQNVQGFAEADKAQRLER